MFTIIVQNIKPCTFQEFVSAINNAFVIPTKERSELSVQSKSGSKVSFINNCLSTHCGRQMVSLIVEYKYH